MQSLRNPQTEESRTSYGEQEESPSPSQERTHRKDPQNRWLLRQRASLFWFPSLQQPLLTLQPGHRCSLPFVSPWRRGVYLSTFQVDHFLSFTESETKTHSSTSRPPKNKPMEIFQDLHQQALPTSILQLQRYCWPPSCLLYTSPSPRDATLSRMPSSA